MDIILVFTFWWLSYTDMRITSFMHNQYIKVIKMEGQHSIYDISDMMLGYGPMLVVL
jgi:hypothetical protein